MKQSFRLSLAFFYILILSCGDSNNDTTQDSLAQTTPDTTSTSNSQSDRHAKNGDSVWIFVNHIKADQRQNFEKLVHEVFFDSSAKLSEKERLVFQQTRILHPTQPEKDGSYSYLFLMDPVVTGGEYEIERLMVKIYGEEKAKDYLNKLSKTEAAEQTGYRLVQSRH